MISFSVIYEKTSTGYSAYVPDLPGCVAAGVTLDDTADLIREAVQLHVQTMRADGDSVPESTTFVGCVSVPD